MGPTISSSWIRAFGREVRELYFGQPETRFPLPPNSDDSGMYGPVKTKLENTYSIGNSHLYIQNVPNDDTDEPGNFELSTPVLIAIVASIVASIVAIVVVVIIAILCCRKKSLRETSTNSDPDHLLPE